MVLGRSYRGDRGAGGGTWGYCKRLIETTLFVQTGRVKKKEKQRDIFFSDSSQ